MSARDLSSVSDGDLVKELKVLVARERELTAAVLEHLGEVEARRLFLPAACSSMHGYCMQVLGMSEEAAFKRLRVARVARRFPVVLREIAEGRLHLSGAVMLASHLTEENADALVAEASGKSKAEIAVVLARWAPKPDRPTRMEPIAEQAELVVPPVSPGPVEQPARARVRPLAPERFSLELTLSGETKRKLERAQALLRHQVPKGDLAQVIDRALDALLEKVEERKFGKAKKPRAQAKAGSGRYVSRAVRREVVARDGERCSFVGEDGRRCDETGFLELDHVVPVAHGGGSDQVRMLCRAHNQWEAERVMGRAAVEAGRAARQMEEDIVAGLKGMGVSAVDARRAVAESRGRGNTIEERLRAALGVLHRLYYPGAARCEEAPIAWEPGQSRRKERTSGASLAWARVSAQEGAGALPMPALKRRARESREVVRRMAQWPVRVRGEEPVV